MALLNRMSLHPDLLWLTISLAQIFQCLYDLYHSAPYCWLVSLNIVSNCNLQIMDIVHIKCFGNSNAHFTEYLKICHIMRSKFSAVKCAAFQATLSGKQAQDYRLIEVILKSRQSLGIYIKSAKHNAGNLGILLEREPLIYSSIRQRYCLCENGSVNAAQLHNELLSPRQHTICCKSWYEVLEYTLNIGG
jgi:hypothetical protein